MGIIIIIDQFNSIQYPTPNGAVRSWSSSSSLSSSSSQSSVYIGRPSVSAMLFPGMNDGDGLSQVRSIGEQMNGE